jgi:hypothetical protein
LVVLQCYEPKYVLLLGLRSMQLKMQFSLNITSILDVVQQLRICQTQSFKRVFADTQITCVP